MAEYTIKDMTGSLFKNENPKNDKSPPMNGKVKIGGVEYWINGFYNESKSGKKYIGLTFSPVDGGGNYNDPSRDDSSEWGL